MVEITTLARLRLLLDCARAATEGGGTKAAVPGASPESAGNEDSAHNLAALMGLVATCRLQRVAPRAPSPARSNDAGPGAIATGSGRGNSLPPRRISTHPPPCYGRAPSCATSSPLSRS
jgi:hypothetical protein